MRFLLRIGIISFFALVSVKVTGQTPYFGIKHFAYTDDGKDFHFPVFYKNSASNLTVEKINQHLQLSELELLNGFQTNTIFEKVKHNNGGLYGGKVDMSDTVYTNTDKLLSLGFDEASSGMTTHYWNRYYTFNAGNGDLIQLSDLFTPDGYRQFHKRLVAKSIYLFKKQLLADSVKDMAHLKDVIDELGKADIEDFYIKGASIYLNGENLLNKNDKLQWDMLVKFSLPEFKPFLNDYGKTVFGLKSGDIAQCKSRSLPQLFTGEIDKYPILFIIRHLDQSEYDGIYCYQKYGRGIYMTGHLINGRIDLEEMNSGFNNKARIIGKLGKDSITATWRKAGGGRPLQLLVARK